jgi:AcrR family transcriptional regulator
MTSGLRERKKRETHRGLTRAAQELVHEHGLEHVTVDDIADAAGVSVRTFFNYFSCKEEAIVGIEPSVLRELADELRARPAAESPVDALRAVVFSDLDASGVLRRWQVRNDLVRRYPALLPRYLASTVEIEVALAAALADRMQVDLAHDPAPRVLAAAALASLRASLAWWEESDRTIPIDDLLDRALVHIRR